METIRIDPIQLKENPFEDINTTEAIKRCEQSFQSYPNDPHVKFLLSRAYMKAKRYKEGFNLASQACQAGDIGGCTLVGAYIESGLVSFPNDDKRSTLLWLWSCVHEHAQACTNLYLKAERHSLFVPKEFNNTKERLLALCKKGNYPSTCHAYAKICFRDRISSDTCLYTASRACRFGNEEGCFFYQDFRENNHTTPSKEKIQQIYQASCNNGNYQACLTLAHSYASKKRTKLNNLLALALYEDTCIKGHKAIACRYAGAYYLSELEGITPNIPKGIRYLEQSCTPYTIYKERVNGSSTKTEYDIRGCLDLAKYYLYTSQAKYRNKEKAKQTLKKACQLTQYYYTSKLGCQLNVDICCKQLPSR